MSSSAALWPGNLAARARLPSAAIATCATHFAHRYGVDQLDRFARDLQATLIELSARLAISARSPARLIDSPGRLLADRHRVDQLRRSCGEVDHVELVVGAGFHVAPSDDPVHRVGHQRELRFGVIARLGGGPKMECISGRFAITFGASGSVADIDDQHLILARRHEHRLARIVPGGSSRALAIEHQARPPAPACRPPRRQRKARLP